MEVEQGSGWSAPAVESKAADGTGETGDGHGGTGGAAAAPPQETATAMDVVIATPGVGVAEFPPGAPAPAAGGDGFSSSSPAVPSGGAGAAASTSAGGTSAADAGAVGGGAVGTVASRTLGGAGRCKDDFEDLKVIGRGSFGKVTQVRERATGKIYAMKVLQKKNIIKRNQVEHTRTERNVLGYVRHPFIVGLNYAFETVDKLYFVLDYCAGGELFFHLGKAGRFPEARACFYAAEIALALEHLHALDIIYRDLKPENVLLTHRGHVRLTDFGLSKEGIHDNATGAFSFCGTPEYLAPEILDRAGHGRAVDWWSLGALLYEMLTGLPPFYCRDREELFKQIKTCSPRFPDHLSQHAVSVLNGLLTKDPSKRLGCGMGDAAELQQHPFFCGIDWDSLLRGRLQPPWRPDILNSLDTSHFDREFTSMPISGAGQADARGADLDQFPNFPFVKGSTEEALAAVARRSGEEAPSSLSSGGPGILGKASSN